MSHETNIVVNNEVVQTTIEVDNEEVIVQIEVGSEAQAEYWAGVAQTAAASLMTPKVFTDDFSSGNIVTVGELINQILLVFRNGSETRAYTDLSTPDGQVEFSPDFGKYTGGNPEPITILYI